MPSTPGMSESSSRSGCSGAWPARNWAEGFVRMRRIDIGGEGLEGSFLSRARIILGIFIVATEPEAARRIWILLSLRWCVESKGDCRDS